MILLDSNVVEMQKSTARAGMPYAGITINVDKCIPEQTPSSDVVGAINCWILSIDAFGRLMFEKI